MKFNTIYFLSLVLISCQSKIEKANTLSIDLETAARELTLFEENIISTPLYERDLAVSPQHDQIIYTLGDYKQIKRCLVGLNQKNGVWEEAKILNISGRYNDIEPFLNKDGNRLYFASNRPIFNDDKRDDYNIWVSDRVHGIWSEPIALDSVINTKKDEFFPSVSDNGNLFFTATRENGLGREDIFRSAFVNGKYQTPEPLPSEINSSLFEFNAYINPEENLIIFSSFGRKDGFGGGDLYISTKDHLGNWTKSKNMGELINSDKLDYCPFIDWKSRNFYFTSERLALDNKKMENINELRKMANSTFNGFGNIYKLGLDGITLINK